jgi:hypothetical protein
VSARVHQWSFERRRWRVGRIARASRAALRLAEAGTSGTDQPPCGHPCSRVNPGRISLRAQNSPTCLRSTAWKLLAFRRAFPYDGSEWPTRVSGHSSPDVGHATKHLEVSVARHDFPLHLTPCEALQAIKSLLGTNPIMLIEPRDRGLPSRRAASRVAQGFTPCRERPRTEPGGITTTNPVLHRHRRHRLLSEQGQASLEATLGLRQGRVVVIEWCIHESCPRMWTIWLLGAFGECDESELVCSQCGFEAPHIGSGCGLKTAVVCEPLQLPFSVTLPLVTASLSLGLVGVLALLQGHLHCFGRWRRTKGQP